MGFLSPLDAVAIGWFAVAWAGYVVLVERTPRGRTTLNARMDRFREVWVRRMLEREARITDMQIMSSLQNGTAFFASTSLIAVGGALAFLRSPDEVFNVLGTLPLGIPAARGLWEIKVIGLTVIFIYAFFKFAWAYRLFNYVAILYGAMPPASEKGLPATEAHVRRTTGLFETAGRHFNRGQRAFFFALGYLGWFIGPVALIVTTIAVVIVMARRQFASDSQRAIAENEG